MQPSDIPVTEPVSGPVIAQLTALPELDNSPCFSSYPDDDEQGRINTARYKRMPCDDLADIHGEALSVEHMVIHQIKLVNQETGEEQYAARTVLIEPSGKAHKTTSYYVWLSLADLFKALGKPPWPGGKLLQLVRGTSRSKRNFFALVPYGGSQCSGIPASDVGLAVPGEDTKRQSESTLPSSLDQPKEATNKRQGH